MFPSLWSSSRSVTTATSKASVTPPSHDSFNQHKHNRQHLHRDIEAATDQLLTPVFVQPLSSQQATCTSNGGINSSRSIQHDGDPFHRRPHNNNNNEGTGTTDALAASTTGTCIIPQQQQQQQLSLTTSYSDSNIRSGNFAANDVLLIDNSSTLPTITKSTTSTVQARGGCSVAAKNLVPEPRLLHSYVPCRAEESLA
jgi:hypothetical protein